MNKIQTLIGKAERIQYRISNNDKKPKSFGTDEKLHHSEIHFIDAVGIEGNLNISQLAEKLGVSKSAITQIVNKLVNKSLVKKYSKEHNKKELYIMLTDSGKVAYYSHLEFHAEMNKTIVNYLSNLDDNDFNVLMNFVDMLDRVLPDVGK